MSLVIDVVCILIGLIIGHDLYGFLMYHGARARADRKLVKDFWRRWAARSRQ